MKSPGPHSMPTLLIALSLLVATLTTSCAPREDVSTFVPMERSHQSTVESSSELQSRRNRHLPPGDLSTLQERYESQIDTEGDAADGGGENLQFDQGLVLPLGGPAAGPGIGHGIALVCMGLGWLITGILFLGAFTRRGPREPRVRAFS